MPDYNAIAADNLNGLMREIAEYTRMAEEIAATLDGPEDIEGYSIYCTSYKVQEEIAAYEGVKPEEVKLYEFSGFSKIPVYKAV